MANGAVGKLAGQAQLARCRLAAELLFPPALKADFRLVNGPFQQLGCLRWAVSEPVIEGVAHGSLNNTGGLLRREAVLGLALKLRLANEDGQHGGRRAHHVFGGDLACAAIADQLAIGPQSFRERLAQAVFMRSAVRCRHRIAVGAYEAVIVAHPGDRPFHRAVTVRLGGAA